MKLERLNELLKKLVQMEDAEENLEMVPLYEEALELSKEIYGEHNLKTLEIYNNYGCLLYTSMDTSEEQNLISHGNG